MNVYVLTATDRTGIEDMSTVLFGVFSTRERATDAILYWMFDGEETAIDYREDIVAEEFITNKNVWRIEKVEVDIVN